MEHNFRINGAPSKKKWRKMAENNHVLVPDMMEFVLQEIGLGYVDGKFKEEKVDIGIVMSVTAKDLI